MTDEMERALLADAEKLRQLTGEEHLFFIELKDRPMSDIVERLRAEIENWDEPYQATLIEDALATIAAQAARIKELEAKVYQQQLDFAQWPSQIERIAALTQERDVARAETLRWKQLAQQMVDSVADKRS